MTIRLRTDAFRKMLHMEMAWHDLPENKPGALTSKISKDASIVNSLTTSVIGTALQNIGGLVSGIVLGMISTW